MSHIKFSTIVKKRSIQIRLNDIGFALTVLMFVLSQQFMNIVKSGQFDSSPLIWIFARFDNPHLLRLILIFLDKPDILPILNRPNMISLRNILKRIPMLDFSKIIKKRFKQIFLRPNTIISRYMISHNILIVSLVKRYNEAILCDIILDLLWFL